MKRRNTPSKEAILDLLAKTKKAMSQDAIEEKLTIAVDRATIYRVLNRFCDDGLVHRIVAEDGKQYFAVCMKCDETKLAANHFHFRCTRCETIECLPVPVHFAIPEGYQVENVNCVLTGVCNDCSVAT
ncbi:Fur family transcriptional regulator [Sphingobacterium pedocola]|uniref:Transcriptional regulator n=1 Tax=Sphingobacterium pedocola TaxID=2082722 RepID=A0ABR9T2X6_9SPHI|nr:transcriptional repressor [Sphingobacterium pedocola]MBE8719701.1 transcriptional regulator [Sphingobacterium pedocola]